MVKRIVRFLVISIILRAFENKTSDSKLLLLKNVQIIKNNTFYQPKLGISKLLINVTDKE